MWVQVEERLRFYDDGVAPRKNATAMAEAMEKFKGAGGADALQDEDAEMAEPEPVVEKPKKKKKKRSSVQLSLQNCPPAYLEGQPDTITLR
jgi:nucleolar protein 56